MSSDVKIYKDKPHLIFCEGADAYWFIIWLLVSFKKNDDRFSTFHVYNFGGINQLSEYLRIISRTEGFKNTVQSIFVIRDAEADANSATQSIKTSLQSCGFAVPCTPCSCASGSKNYPDIATGFALFPKIDELPEKGTLEDLCLSILVKEDACDVLHHADAALELYKDKLAHLHKNRLHTYFSMTNEFVSLKIGEASKCGAFNYETQEIQSLKDFLLHMANGNNE